MQRLPALLQPEPLSPQQAAAGLRLHRGLSDTPRQGTEPVPCRVFESWCTQGFV